MPSATTISQCQPLHGQAVEAGRNVGFGRGGFRLMGNAALRHRHSSTRSQPFMPSRSCGRKRAL